MTDPGEHLIRAAAESGWQPSPTVDGLMERHLWESAPGFSSVSLLRFPRGSGISAPHHHASNQFMYCLSGSYAYSSSGMVLEPGSFYWNDAGNKHGPTEALEDTVLLEIYDGRHYDEPDDDLLVPEHRIGTELLHSNAVVNIWDVTLQPGQAIPWHRHRYPYVVVTVQASRSEITEKDTSEQRTVQGSPGSVVFDPGGAHHTLRNVGDALIMDRLIEFKVPTGDHLPPRFHRSM